jgi:pimeloyl-ACP methyl ester carboxylesterase
MLTLIASWLDHSRDLLHMINHFKTEMPMPLVGIGHSLGGAQLVNLALMHPRLLRTLVLMDPVIEAIKSPSKEDAEARMTGTIPAHASTFRRDIWPSRAEAEASFLKQKYYQAWDKRVLAAWLEYGLRETPTAIYPQDNGSVTLTCTKHQEVFTFLRPILTKNEKAVDYPDGMEGCLNSVPPMHFYRPEPPMLMSRMPNLRPSTLFIFGEISPMSTPGLQQHKMAITGTGEGGSGGEKEGRVKKAVLKDIGHLVAMEAVDLCADAAAPWLGQELRIWQNELKVYQDWSKQAKLDKIMVSEEWKSKMGGPPRRGNTKAKI